MPCVGFICPMTRQEVDWDHFEECTHRGGFPAFPPEMAAFHKKRTEAYNKRKEEEGRSGYGLSGTRILGCPRQTVLEVLKDWRMNPGTSAGMIRGSMMHEKVDEETDKEIWYTEGSDPEKMKLKGKLFGEDVVAIPDRLRKDMSELVSLKFPNDFNVRYRTTEAKTDWQAQLNIERLLLAQQDWAIEEGYDPDTVKMYVWDYGVGKVDPPKALSVKYMSEEELFRFKPGGNPKNPAKYTCGNNAEVLAWAQDELEKCKTEAERDQVVASMPMTGETQFNGKKCIEYCGVEKLCSGLVRVYGYPQEIEFEKEM